jgi:hypothetical protein
VVRAGIRRALDPGTIRAAGDRRDLRDLLHSDP